MADKLFAKYIPSKGKTLWVESEVVRAMNCLHYDYYNNGFCNNMSEAMAYIEKYHFPNATIAFKEAFAPIREMAMSPWKEKELGCDFNITLQEVYLVLYAGESVNMLTPLTEEMFDMPKTEIEGIDYDFDDEDFEEG